MFVLESRRRPPPEINLSALIDIAFILVIFIVLGASFQRVRAVDVDLPAVDGRASPQPDGLIVVVPRSGPILVGDVVVDEVDLDAALARAKASHAAVTLMADRDAAVERALRVLTKAQAQGFSAVSVVTRREEAER